MLYKFFIFLKVLGFFIFLGQTSCLERDRLTKMTSFWGQATWAKMMSHRGKLRLQACHLTKKVNKPISA